MEETPAVETTLPVSPRQARSGRERPFLFPHLGFELGNLIDNLHFNLVGSIVPKGRAA